MKIILFIFMMIASSAGAISLKGGGGSFVQRDRGFFSIGFLGGYQQSSIMNQDGTSSGYKGTLYGLSLDISLLGSGTGEIRLFGSTLAGSASGISQDTDKLNRNETLYGLKVYANSSLFLALATGNISQKSKTAVAETTMTNSIVALGSGLDFAIGEGSMLISLQGWYKTGFISKADNATLAGNSNFGAVEGHLVFVWSPPMTTISVSGR